MEEVLGRLDEAADLEVRVRDETADRGADGERSHGLALGERRRDLLGRDPDGEEAAPGRVDPDVELARLRIDREAVLRGRKALRDERVEPLELLPRELELGRRLDEVEGERLELEALDARELGARIDRLPRTREERDDAPVEPRRGEGLAVGRQQDLGVHAEHGLERRDLDVRDLEADRPSRLGAEADDVALDGRPLRLEGLVPLVSEDERAGDEQEGGGGHGASERGASHGSPPIAASSSPRAAARSRRAST